MIMSTPSAHPDFHRIQSEWYKRLKDSGFNDIEDTTKSVHRIKASGTVCRYRGLDPYTKAAKEAYFEIVSVFVESTAFPSERERLIMRYYADGISQATIQKLLDIPGHRSKVYRPIYRWLSTWGLKR